MTPEDNGAAAYGDGALAPSTEPRRPKRGSPPLSRNVVILSWVSFFQDTASEMLYPVLPLFLTGTLGAPVAVVGLIEGVAEGTAAITKVGSGWLADRVRRRPLVAAGYGLSSVSKLLIALATAWPLVGVARFADRFGKGFRGSPRDALIADDTPAEIRGRAFGFHRALDTAGAVAGPLIGIGLYELLHHNIRPMFVVAFVPAVLSVALVGLVREHAPTIRRLKGGGRSRLPKSFWRVTLFLTVFGFFNFSDALLILRAKGLGLSFVAVLLVYALYNLVYASISYPAGLVSDRIPRRLVFAAGLAIFAVAYGGLGLARSGALVWPLFALYGAYAALTDGVGKAWISDLVAPDVRGTALGVYQGIGGSASVVAGVWAGLAWGADGTLPLLVSGVAVAVLAVVLTFAGGPSRSSL